MTSCPWPFRRELYRVGDAVDHHSDDGAVAPLIWCGDGAGVGLAISRVALWIRDNIARVGYRQIVGETNEGGVRDVHPLGRDVLVAWIEAMHAETHGEGRLDRGA